MDYNPVTSPVPPCPPPPAASEKIRHSGFGITAFIISIVMALFLFMLIISAGIMEASTPGGIDEESVGAVAIGLLILGGIGLDMLGLIFGMIGLFQKDRKKVFAILGTVFSAVTILGTASLVILGLAMG